MEQACGRSTVQSVGGLMMYALFCRRHCDKAPTGVCLRNGATMKPRLMEQAWDCSAA